MKVKKFLENWWFVFLLTILTIGGLWWYITSRCQKRTLKIDIDSAKDALNMSGIVRGIIALAKLENEARVTDLGSITEGVITIETQTKRAYKELTKNLDEKKIKYTSECTKSDMNA